MSDIKNRNLYWLAQFIGWTSYAALIFLASYANDPSKINYNLIVNIISLILFGILSTHLMRYFYLKMNWLELKLPPLIPRILVTSIICSIFISVTTTILNITLDPKEIKDLTPLNFIINIFAISVLILFWNSIYFTFHFFQKSRNSEINNLSLEASRNEVELKNLRSQLNPHFLFNSLNSIKALIGIEPEKAKISITTLSNLLRKSLILGKVNLVSLEEEMEMVSNYLDLEKIRFEERLTIVWNLDETLMNFEIPPFSLQMLVENAIKHGISNLISGGEVEIITQQNTEEICISVINSGSLKSKSDTGIGIENTKRRLALQYVDKARFELFEFENKVQANLIFKK